MLKTACLILLIWLCLSQITLNQRQYAVKKIRNNRQSKDLKKIQVSNRQLNRPNRFSAKNNPFRDFLSESSEMVITKDDWNNDVVNNWNTNSWNSWEPPANGWQSGWWQQDPWKDPYTKLSLVKIKPEIQEVYAADVLIRENRNSNFGINGFVQFVQFVSLILINLINFN